MSEDKSHLLTEKVIAQEYAMYKRLGTEQREVLDDHEVFAHLCMNLRNLERLEKIEIHNFWSESLTREDYPYSRRRLDPLPRSLGFVQRHWSPLHLEPSVERISRYETLTTVLRAFSITQTRVKQIICDPYISEPLFATTPMPGSTLRHPIQVFQHLRKLVLAFDCESGTTGIRNLATVLNAAARLQDLYLRLAYIMSNIDTVEIVFGHQIWLHLSTLNLVGFSFRFAQLQDLLRRHAETLRLLTLSECYLEDGSWIDIVDVLRSDLKLLKCNISDIREADAKPIPSHLLEWQRPNEYLWHGGKDPLRES